MEILGEGCFGCVIKKDENFVVKYGIKDEIMLEYKNIKLLPKRNFYFDVDLASIDRVTLNEQLEIFSISSVFDYEIIRDNQTNICLSKLTIPLIYGFDLGDYYHSKISFDEWYKMIVCFIELCYKIKELNDIDNIFHNDLHISNIIYDINNNIMKIIDFTTLTIGISKNNLGNDIIDLLTILSSLLFGVNDNIEIGIFLKTNGLKKYNLEDLDYIASIFIS
jgi:serine/threonine protein kinase